MGDRANSAGEAPAAMDVLNGAERDYALKYAELLKNEIVHHQNYLYNSTLANFVGIPTLLSLSKEFDFSLFNLLLPLIVIFLMYLPVYYQNAIIRCARYIRYEIEPKLLSGRLIGYENFLEHDGFGRIPEIYFRRVTATAFTIYFIFSLGLSINDTMSRGWTPQRFLTDIGSVTLTDAFYLVYFAAVFAFFVVSSIYIRKAWHTHSGIQYAGPIDRGLPPTPPLRDAQVADPGGDAPEAPEA